MAPCNPPLQFVQNGAAGSAFPPPLDPTPPQFGPPSPTFEESACSLLGQDLCGGMDPISAIDELTALTDAIDALTSAADANLDAILLELDQLGHQQVSDAFDEFAGAEPGAMSLVGDVTGVALPALGTIPLTLPNGQATLTFGGAPSAGGVPTAGSAQYVLHLPVIPVGPGVHSVTVTNLTGPNPPFVTAGQGFAQETVNGRLMWVALVTINPAAPGAFTGVLYYDANVTITGISGTLHRTLPFQVVVQ